MCYTLLGSDAASGGLVVGVIGWFLGLMIDLIFIITCIHYTENDNKKKDPL